MILELSGIGAIFDAEVNDFAGCFGVGKVEGWGRVELDVLGCYTEVDTGLKTFAVHAEELDGKAAGLGYAVLQRVRARPVVGLILSKVYMKLKRGH
jgi:hypothetical protein